MSKESPDPSLAKEIDEFIKQDKQQPINASTKVPVQKVGSRFNPFGDPTLAKNRHLKEGYTDASGNYIAGAKPAGAAAAAPEEPQAEAPEQTDWYADDRTPDLPGSKADLMGGKRVLDQMDRLFYNFEKEKWERQIASAIRRNTRAVILIGGTGVGKTTMVEEAAELKSLKVKVFNVPNMDPFLHLVGVPHIKEGVLLKPGEKASKEATLEFVRKNDLEEADIIFLDELNRVDQQTQNQLFEVVNSRSINGVRLPNLRSIWAAINPPSTGGGAEGGGGYAVHSLEKAFAGRFWKVIKVEAKPKIHHFAGRDSIGEAVARTCLRWWYQHIKGKELPNAEEMTVPLEEIVSPRVLFYICAEVQRMNNDLQFPREGEKYTMRDWNADFESLTYHHELNTESLGVVLPYPALKAELMGEEMFALGTLRNDHEDIEARCQEAGNREKGLRMADILKNAFRSDLSTSTSTSGGKALVPVTDIGDFSQVLCAMHRDNAALVVVNNQSFAWYLWAKNNWKEEQRVAYAAKSGNPHDPITTPLNQGEIDIYRRMKDDIDRVIKSNQAKGDEKKIVPGRVAGGGAPQIAGGLGAPQAGGTPTVTTQSPKAAPGTPVGHRRVGGQVIPTK